MSLMLLSTREPRASVITNPISVTLESKTATNVLNKCAAIAKPSNTVKYAERNVYNIDRNRESISSV